MKFLLLLLFRKEVIELMKALENLTANVEALNTVSQQIVAAIGEPHATDVEVQVQADKVAVITRNLQAVLPPAPPPA